MIFALLLLLQTPDPYPALRAELERLLDSDQKLRGELVELEKEHGWQSKEVQQLWDRQNKIDAANQKRIAEIFSQHGWLSPAKVGPQASSAAFLIVQHAPLEFQQQYWPLLEKAAANGELKKSSLALLEDRILMRQGKPQIYGSQLVTDPETQKLKLHPIADEEHVDERRRAAGLPPLAEYLKYFGLEYRPLKKQ